MTRTSKITATLLVFCCLLVSQTLGQVEERILNAVSLEPPFGSEAAINAAFYDHLGQPTTIKQTLNGKPAVLCLVYFQCPMLCKLAADGLVKSLAEVDFNVGKEFEVLVISFDPNDTVEQAALSRTHLIRRYARPGTDRGWNFFTGEESSIEELTDSLGYHYVWDEQTKQYAHPAGVFLLSPQGVITNCLSGVEFPKEELSAAIESARLGVVSEVAGDFESNTFLRCYLYDPTTGKFGIAVQWTIRVLGLGTVLAIVLGVGSLLQRERELESTNK